MLTYPNIAKVAFQLGPVSVYWYGIMYFIGFSLAWVLAKLRVQKLKYAWDADRISDFIFYCALGAVVGGRLGYVWFYDWQHFLQTPLMVLEIWRGGMSFHGGLLGLLLGLGLFSAKHKLSYLSMMDFAVPLAPLGLAFGRLGNFINGELFGRVTTVPWGMVFPEGGPWPRHPSQLYEMVTEGIFLFVIFWCYSAKPRPRGVVSGWFLLSYGLMRIGCEFFREPDYGLGFVWFDKFTMGQVLSLPMIIVGLGMVVYFRRIPVACGDLESRG